MSLAVCARDVKFYEWPSINFMGAYEVPAECMSVKSISWCCDGSSILVVKSKGEPLIAKAPTKSETRISTHKCVPINNVYTGAFSKINPHLLALGMENGDISTFNLDTKDLFRYKKLPSGIQNLDISLNDKNLLAGCFDGNIFLYDTKGRPSASFMVPNCYSLSTTMFSNYSDLLAGASKDGTLAVWNAETTDLKFSCKEHTARITDIVFLENTVTSVGTDGYLCLFDLRTHDVISKCNLDGALSSLAYFSGSYDLAVGTYNQLRSYDVRYLNTPIRTLLINNGGHIKNIAASPLALKGNNQSSENDLITKSCEENISASGDFSILSNNPSNLMSGFKDLISNQVPSQKPSFTLASSKPSRTYKMSEVKALEKFVSDYMKYTSTLFSEKMAQSFYALRINTSKQFICMGEKMDESWSNFIAYLRYAGDSEKGSNLCSRVASETELHKRH